MKTAPVGKQWDRHWPCMRTGTGFCKDAGRLLGGQDTPLGYLRGRYKERIIGPKQFSRPESNGRHCYRTVFIRGRADFIFGSTQPICGVWCILPAGIHRERGYVTAASTKARNTGMCSRDCRFYRTTAREASSSPGGMQDHVLIDCYLGPHMTVRVKHDWDTDARSTPVLRYAEAMDRWEDRI